MAVLVTRANLPAAPTGLAASAVHGWIKCYNEESGVLVDRTTEFITVANDVESFAADDDYVYFSIDSTITADDRVAHIHIVLSQVASADILPVFEYSTGDDSWAALSVTDGTNGFTQNGSIIVNLTTFPTYQVWQVATKDGNGNTVGDGAARRYIRIKRTVDTLATPPKISECGSGILTANKTYYYKAITTKDGTFWGNSTYSRSKSAPSSEFSATTTTVKRTIKIDIDTSGNMYVVWRSPTSGDYSQSYASTASGKNDTTTQTVKGYYFQERCGTGGADSVLMDNGVPDKASYSDATVELFSYYREVLYSDRERAELTVDTTDASVATFQDIYDECQTQGWTDSLVRLHGSLVDSDFRRKVYEVNDNISIKGDFEDGGITLLLTAVIITHESNSVTFGRRAGSSPIYHYDNGVDFILTQVITYNGRFHFANTNFYSCRFIQAGILSTRIYSWFPTINDDCELYDVFYDGFSNMERPIFDGANIVLNNVRLSKTRYGLVITPSTLDTIEMTDLVVQGGIGMQNFQPYWNEGDEFTFRNFKYINVSVFLISYGQASNDSQVTLNWVNPELINTSITTSKGGQYWIYNEIYSLDLKVIDVDGNEIETANVVIKDSNGVELFDGNTDASGDIAQQELVYKIYTGGTLFNETYRQYNPDDVTTIMPHTVTITKAGYASKTIIYTMDRKREDVETLEKIKDLNYSKKGRLITTS